MKHAMATRNPTRVGVSRDDCTNFQMHKTLHPQFSEAKKKLVDFTEHKLLRYISTVEDIQQRGMLIELIERYCKGHIAVAWKRGRPVYVDLTKDK